MLNVREFRIERGLSGSQVTAVIRERYPGYDKHLQCKVENPDKYGIKLVNDAERALEEAFAKTAPEPKKRDNRRLPARIQCRMSHKEYERLQRALRLEGYETIQAGLLHIIEVYLNNGK